MGGILTVSMDIQDYLKSLNPNAKLDFGSSYMLYIDGKYLGIGKWTEDNNVGGSFQREKENGVNEVIIADHWIKINQV